PTHVVGLSMGGFIAMRLAFRHPQTVRSLVLLDTNASPEDPERVQRNEAMAQVVEGGDLEAVLPALPPIFLADDYIVEHRAAVDDWLARVAAADPHGAVLALRGFNTREDLVPRLGEIGVPTLVIHGREDAAIPVEEAERIAAGIAGARLELVSGGHQSNVDRAEETSRLIREFLVSIESGAAPMTEDRIEKRIADQ
ncbi:MAG: alpha/beta fold hydrolase, partial [Candidatus Dormibacteraeota bacterium]|nr:alpha/beta fold hydrolase [Candidatus Dormibacteraeota bacterium]